MRLPSFEIAKDRHFGAHDHFHQALMRRWFQWHQSRQFILAYTGLAFGRPRLDLPHSRRSRIGSERRTSNDCDHERSDEPLHVRFLRTNMGMKLEGAYPSADGPSIRFTVSRGLNPAEPEARSEGD